MKSIRKKHRIRLRKALAVAYREKEKAEVGELWQVRVMGHIQSLGTLYSQTSYIELFGRFVWQLAPMAFVLVVLLGAIVTQLELVSDYEIVKMFMEDPADLSLLALYK